MTHADIISRYAREAGKPEPSFLASRASNVFVGGTGGGGDARDLYSWGTHFALARIMLDAEGNRSWWLVNGDRYSLSTDRHQAQTRDALAATELPMLILSFSCLDSAGIRLDSIKPVSVLADRTEYFLHSASTLEEVPEEYRWQVTSGMRLHTPVADDGRLYWETFRHWLGDSLFTADFSYWDRLSTRMSGSASFLSSFDYQETQPLYFMCQLAQGSAPATVADAIEALKPEAVTAAQAAGLPVTRQGDVFAVETAYATRQLTKLAPIVKQPYVLDVNHTASEVIEIDGTTYARGFLRHRPKEHWRAPEHKMVRMGDGKTWHVLVKNTVPAGRAWSVSGRVD